MNIYAIGLAAIALLTMLGWMTHGFHAGFAKEISGMISMIAAVIVIMLIAGGLNSLQNKSFSNVAVGLVLLVILGIVYKIIHVFMTSINFIARLPVIKWLDSALGMILGLIEGFAVLYAMEYLLRNFLLV